MLRSFMFLCEGLAALITSEALKAVSVLSELLTKSLAVMADHVNSPIESTEPEAYNAGCLVRVASAMWVNSLAGCFSNERGLKLAGSIRFGRMGARGSLGSVTSPLGLQPSAISHSANSPKIEGQGTKGEPFVF
jgi:hypothetical protein